MVDRDGISAARRRATSDVCTGGSHSPFCLVVSAEFRTQPVGTEDRQCSWEGASGPEEAAVTVGYVAAARAPLLVVPSLASAEDETVDARMLAVVAARLEREEEEELEVLVLTPVSELTSPQWQRLGDTSVARAYSAADAKEEEEEEEEEANQEDPVALVLVIAPHDASTILSSLRHVEIWSGFPSLWIWQSLVWCLGVAWFDNGYTSCVIYWRVWHSFCTFSTFSWTPDPEADSAGVRHSKWYGLEGPKCLALVFPIVRHESGTDYWQVENSWSR